MPKAVNPETGEVLLLVNNQWVAPQQTAVNDQGNQAFLVNNEWVDDSGKSLTPEKSILGYAGETLKAIPRGAIGMLESAAIGASAALPEETEKSARAGIKSMAEAAKAPFAAAHGYEETVPVKLFEGVGSTVPYFALGPLGVAGRVGGAGLGIAAGAGEARTRAEEAGATPGERAIATAIGAPIGALEMLPVERFTKALGAPLTGGIIDRGRRILATGGAEGLQEFVSEAAQNLVQQQVYDPERGIFTGTGEAFGYGAGVGGLIQGLTDMVLGKKAKGPKTRREAEAAAAEEAPQAPPVSSEEERREAFFKQLQTGEQPEAPVMGEVQPAPVPEEPTPPVEPTTREAPAAPETPLLTAPEAPVTGEEPTVPPPETPPGVPPGVAKLPEGVVLQNRNRSSDASVLQMNSIANSPDYGRLAFSNSFTDGAPVVFGALDIPAPQLGRKGTITTAQGKKIPVQYAVVSASQILPSNRVDGSTVAEYADPNVPAFKAVTNGRIAGLQEAFRRNTAGQYVQDMISDDIHGVNPEVIKGIQDPVLVRLMPSDQVTKDIADQSNTPSTMKLTATETAKNDANRIDLGSLTFGEEGEVTPQTVKDFIAAMPKTEQNDLIGSGGQPTTQAYDRLNNAIFSKAYQNDSLITLAAAAKDPEAANVIRGLSQAGAQMAQLEGKGEYDIRPQVVQAAEVAVNARRRGINLQKAIDEQDMLTQDPVTSEVLKLFAANARSPKKIAEGLAGIANAVNREATLSQEPDMFGEVAQRRPVLDAVRIGLGEQTLAAPTAVATPKAEKPTAVQISPEEQKKQALDAFAKNIAVVVPAFDGQRSDGRVVRIAPRPLSKQRQKLLVELANDAIKLGMPASLLAKVTKAGSTNLANMASIASARGWLMLGSQWERANKAEKIHTLIHEIAHAVDRAGVVSKKFSGTSSWAKAKQELRDWFGKNPTTAHPMAYPFLPSVIMRSKPDLDKESFAQAFGCYFTDPVALRNNAPSAYSQIQSIVEGIQNESGRVAETGGAARGPAEVDVQQARAGVDKAVQPEVGKIERDISGIERVKPPAAPTEIEEVRRNYEGAPVEEGQYSWTSPPDTALMFGKGNKTSLVQKLQDKFVDLKDIQNEIKKNGRSITDAMNTYLKETLFHKKVAYQQDEFLRKELDPLLKDMIKMGVTKEELNKYLQAKHAKERNEHVARINPELPDGGSGITTSDAEKYLADMDPKEKEKLESLSKRIRDMIYRTQAIEAAGGLEDVSTFMRWNKRWPNYVPLFRDEVDYAHHGSGMGQGLSSRGPTSKQAVGSLKDVKEILSSIAEQRAKAIVRSEKAAVGRSLFALAVANPNPDFWLPVSPEKIKDPDALREMMVSLGFDPAVADQMAKNVMEEPKVPVIKRVKNANGEFDDVVVYEINPNNRFSDNVLPVRIDGADSYIIFNPQNERAKRLGEALKNMDTEQLGTTMKHIGQVTRWIAAMSTQYNPIFGIWNFTRDVQGAGLNLSSTPLKGKQAVVMSNAFRMIPDIWREIRANRQGGSENSQTAQLFREFSAAGGPTGYRDQFTKLENQGTIVERRLKELNAGNVRSAVSAIGNWISDYNDVLENAVRLAAFKEAKQIMSVEQAASLAKELTVNFNRKGSKTPGLSALFAFFNSAVQGTTRLVQTLKGPAGKKIIAGGIMLGVVQSLILHAFDYEDDEPPEFLKQRNLIIPLGDGNYAMWPMPLGFNFLPTLGRQLSDMVISDKTDPRKTVVNMLEAFSNSFNPLGGGGFMQTLSPTIIDPFVAVSQNKDAFGRPISREDRATSPSPGYLRSRESASEFSKVFAEILNYMSFGSEYKKGLISPTADALDYIVGQYLGGVGREVQRIGQFAKAIAVGEEVEPFRVPLAGKIVGAKEAPGSISAKFYSNVTALAEHELELKGRAEKQQSVAEYLRDNPEARLYKAANKLENEISKINRTIKQLQQMGGREQQIEVLKNRKTQIMKTFNEQFSKAQR